MYTAVTVAFDTGVFVLIWLVQLVIYPGFCYYPSNALKNWHNVYTKRVTLVVLPLMFGQLLLGLINVFSAFSALHALKLVFILTAWLLTFGIFVPLHSAVNRATPDELDNITKKLVRKNWYRTAVWSVVLVITMLQVLIPDLF